MAKHRVVSIHDASRELNTFPIPWAIDKLKLIPGDSMTLLGVLNHIETPMGYKSKVDSSSIFGANKKMIKEAVQRKVKEFQSNPEITELGDLCESHGVDFKIEVVAGPLLKETALEEAANLKATWVILDRHMKNDNKYFLQRLPCGISQMKDDNRVELLRGRKPTKGSRPPPVPIHNHVVSGEETASVQAHLPVEDPSPSALEPSTSSTVELYTIEIGGEEMIESRQIDPRATESIDNEGLVLDKINVGDAKAGEGEDETTGEAESGKGEAKTRGIDVVAGGGEAEDKEGDAKTGGGKVETRKGEDENQRGEEETGKEKVEDQGIEAASAGGDSECEICSNKRFYDRNKRNFTYKELHDLTGGFSPDNRLSTEEFGSAYKGQLKDGMTVVVKMNKSALDDDEFEAKVNMLSKASHKNVITLLGSCREGNNMLVYEYVCNGSLDQHLSELNSKAPTWTQRLDIALYAAKGLHHLHENRIIHQNIKSDNNILTHDVIPLIGELSIKGGNYDSNKFSEEMVRYSDYRAPEYNENGKLSSKTDVYSFGVVLLELITGRVVTEMTLMGTSLLSWARPFLSDRKYLELVDPRLGKSCDAQQLVWMFQLTRNCLAKNPKRRITMDGVVSALEFILSQRSTMLSDVWFPEGGAELN